MGFTESEWIFLNDLSLKIHSIEPLDAMRVALLDLLQMLIPTEKSTFYLADDSQKHLMRDPVSLGFEEQLELLGRYLDEFEDIDPMRWVFATAQNQALRQTDLFPEDLRVRLPFYDTRYKEANIHYAAILSLSHSGVFVGAVSLYRSREGGDFSDREMAFLEILKNHLSFRLYREMPLYAQEARRKAIASRLADLKNSFNLTAREFEILLKLVRGEPIEKISRDLFITVSTLKKHTTKIFKKMGVKNRLGLFNIVEPF
jgi:DNA-binding CsgD family transcriptional regulator